MKKLQKKLSCLMALLMLLAVIPFQSAAIKASGRTVAEIWDGSFADCYAGGSGTQDDPFLISNGAELAYFSEQVNSGNKYDGIYFKLTDDIFLNDTADWENWGTANPDGNIIAPANTWVPIGLYHYDWGTDIETDNPFNGYFDGDSRTVFGIYINKSPDDFNTSDYLGLFGYNKGEIRNLDVKSSYISGGQNVGGIAGWSAGIITNCCSMNNISGSYCGGIIGNNSGIAENCHNSHDIHGSSNVGGVIGYSTNLGNVKNCSNSANIIGDDSVGGIIGNNCSNLINCENSGSISGTGNIGGVVGFNEGSLNNCTNSGACNGENGIGGIMGFNFGNATDCNNSGNVTGLLNCGGICGSNASSIFICSNSGVVAGNEKAGGIAGSGSGSVKVCYNDGDVTGTAYVGGIVGFSSEAKVIDCYNTGNIVGNDYIGGITGTNLDIYIAPDGVFAICGTAQTCYNIGTVSGDNNVGAVIGYNTYTDEDGSVYAGIVNNCYYLDTCCTSEDTSSTSLSDAQTQIAASFAGFDFAKVWTMDETTDYPYPEFKLLFEITFEDGYTHEEIPGGYFVAAGTLLDESSFPEAPVHEGCTFIGWNYNGEAIYDDTVIKALYDDPNAAKLNCYITYNYTGAANIWAEFSSFNPAQIENHGAMPQTSAAAFAGGNVYGYLNNIYENDTSFYIMNSETYEVTYTNFQAGRTVYAMAYDYSEGEMYAVADNENNQKSIYKVNLASGILQYAVKLDEEGQTIVSLAIDGDGNAYGIDNSMTDSSLYSINLLTGVCTVIGQTGKAFALDGAITWDHNSDKLFWAQYCDENDNGLYAVNPADGALTACGKIDGGAMATCLWSKNDKPIAPIVVPEFEITFISGITNEEIPGGYTVEAGTILDEADFPEPPVYEDCEFIRWEYDREPIYTDTAIKAIYSYPDAAILSGYVYDFTSFMSSWGEFAEYDPASVTFKETSFEPSAAAYAGGNVYGFLTTGEFYIMNAETYEVISVGYNPNVRIFAMAYDHSRETMYALGDDASGLRSLYKVNLAIGVLEYVAPVDAGDFVIMTLAIDGNGNGYCLSLSTWGDNGVELSKLWSINLETGLCTAIGETGLKLQFLQSMTWDHNSDRLFWAQYADESSNGLYTVDPCTGEVTFCGRIGAGYEVTSLWIADNLAAAPVEAPDFQITFIDAMTGEEIPGGYLAQGGTVLDPSDFPEPPVHEGCEFVCWNYGGELIYQDTVIRAIYKFPGAATLNGYITYDPAGDYGIWGRFAEYAPYDIENMGAIPDTFAAAYMNGNVYGYLVTGEFYIMNPETYRMTIMDDVTDNLVYAMAYNTVNETMYALVQNNEDGSCGLYTIDTLNGNLTYCFEVNSDSGMIFTFAIDDEGNAYGLASGQDAGLYAISLENGECTFIGKTGRTLNFVQSMTWDHNTDKLFWAQYGNDMNNSLCIINPATGETTALGKIGNGAEVTALWIAYDENAPLPTEPPTDIPTEPPTDVPTEPPTDSPTPPETGYQSFISIGTAIIFIGIGIVLLQSSIVSKQKRTAAKK